MSLAWQTQNLHFQLAHFSVKLFLIKIYFVTIDNVVSYYEVM